MKMWVMKKAEEATRRKTNFTQLNATRRVSRAAEFIFMLLKFLAFFLLLAFVLTP